MENIMYQPNVERETVNGIGEISLVTNAFANRKIFLFGQINQKTLYLFICDSMAHYAYAPCTFCISTSFTLFTHVDLQLILMYL